MAKIDNLLGQKDTVTHHDGTYFNKTFTVTDSAGSAFSLADYSGVFSIKKSVTGDTLYTKTSGDGDLTFSSNTFTIQDLIDLGVTGSYYFQLEITHSTDAEKVFIPWYGTWKNVNS